MPVHPVSGGWQWGNSGKVYPKKADALDQQTAAYANGFRENSGKKNPVAQHPAVQQHAARSAAQKAAILNLMKKHHGASKGSKTSNADAAEEAGEPKLSPAANAKEEAAEQNASKRNTTNSSPGTQPPWLAAAARNAGRK